MVKITSHMYESLSLYEIISITNKKIYERDVRLWNIDILRN